MHLNLGVFINKNIPLHRLFSQWQGKKVVLLGVGSRAIPFAKNIEENFLAKNKLHKALEDLLNY